jgi:integrase
MSILAECPICCKKQSLRYKICVCGENLDKAKRSKRVKFWINYRMPDGKQRREPVGFSIEEARAAEGKRRTQKKENRIFDMLPESKITFDELTKWYLDLASVKNLSSYRRIQGAFKAFNSVFGNRVINSVLPIDIEGYQEGRINDGKSFATVDMEVFLAKTMVTKAFDNDMVDGKIIKAFRPVKRKLKFGNNARKRVVTVDEYLRLIDHAPSHLKPFIILAYNTGMRQGELLNLKWAYIDRKSKFIRLPAEAVKERRPKNIPINAYVEKVLDNTVRHLNHEFVLTYLGQPIAEGGIKKSFQTTCKNAGISFGRNEADGITFHDIRRSVKTHMLNAGVGKTFRDALLGHSLKGMDFIISYCLKRL